MVYWERVGEHLMGPCKNSVTLVMHGKHPTSRDILYKLMDTHPSYPEAGAILGEREPGGSSPYRLGILRTCAASA